MQAYIIIAASTLCLQLVRSDRDLKTDCIVYHFIILQLQVAGAKYSSKLPRAPRGTGIKPLYESHDHRQQKPEISRRRKKLYFFAESYS